MTDFERLLQKVIEDSKFLDRLRENPGAALQELKINPTKEKISALQVVAGALNNAKDVINESIDVKFC